MPSRITLHIFPVYVYYPVFLYGTGMLNAKPSLWFIQVVKGNLNPTWRPLRVKASQLCGGDFDSPIKVCCIV